MFEYLVQGVSLYLKMESAQRVELETNLKAEDSKEAILLGIDEAGRGPVLGPMVYACCYWAEKGDELIVKRFKFADSKKLSENKRDEIFELMSKNRDILE